MYQETKFFKKCKFLGSNRKIVQLTMEHDVWQPIVDQALFIYILFFNPN